MSVCIPGLVPEQAGEGEEAEKGCRAPEVGAVLPQHEALEGQLQVRQGQHPGRGPGQRRRRLLHRWAEISSHTSASLFTDADSTIRATRDYTIQMCIQINVKQRLFSNCQHTLESIALLKFT